MTESLNQIGERIGNLKLRCRWCNHPITARDIKSRNHERGREVDNYTEPQWIYFHCRGCDYDWSLGKLVQQYETRIALEGGK